MVDEALMRELEKQIDEAVSIARSVLEDREREPDAEQAGDVQASEETCEDGGNRLLWRLVFVLAVIAAVVCAVLTAIHIVTHRRSERVNSQLREYVDYDAGSQTVTVQEDAGAEPDYTAMDIKVDFEELAAANDDITAWIYIPGTDVNYPVMQGDDNSYYLSHDAYGRYSPDGSIFMDAACGSDFSDFNTIIYGHNMSGGTMFKTLHNYEDAGFLETNGSVYIYLPDRTLRFEVFAAYRTDDRHILTYNDFSKKEARQSYLNKIYDEEFDVGTVKNDETVDVDSSILTLSTCCGIDGKRWLVQGVLAEEKVGN